MMKEKCLVRQKILNGALVVAGVCFLGACGKKGPPTIAAGQEDLYPAFYPLVEEADTGDTIHLT